MDSALPLDCLGRTDAARRIGVSAPTISRWIDRGLIAGYRVGGRIYVNKAEIEAMLANARIPAAA